MTADDMELVRQYVANQSESAFAALVARHTNLVYSASLRIARDPQLAEEVTQVVFIIFARKAGSFSEKTILPSWLYRATCYTAGSALKRERRRQQREQEAYMQSTLHETGPEPAWAQIAPVLEEAMLRLSQADRDALVLRFFENRSLNEVGAALGASEDAAKKRVNRALEKLRKFFSKRGMVSTTTIIAGAISAHSVQAAPTTLAQSVTVIAFAKGATAGGSTAALIKGVLKLMAWTKVKTAVVIGMGVLLTAGTAMVIEQQQSGAMEYKGTLKLVFLKPQIGASTNDAPAPTPETNIYQLRLLSEPPNWELSLVSPTSRHGVFASPKHTFEVDYYDNPPAGPLNTAFIKIYPGARPWSDRGAEHVWLAVLSGKTFLNQQLPFSDPGLGMGESSTVTQADGAPPDASPRQMRWINESPQGRTTRIEGEFKWLAATNLSDGVNLPVRSEMEISLVDSGTNHILITFSELTIDSARPSNIKPVQVPMIPGRSAINDYRASDLRSFSWGGFRKYDVMDSKGLENGPPDSNR